jgi:hypothetical protein
MALHIARVNCPFLVRAIQPKQIALIAPLTYNTHMQQCLPQWQDRRKGQQFLLNRSMIQVSLHLMGYYHLGNGTTSCLLQLEQHGHPNLCEDLIL